MSLLFGSISRSRITRLYGSSGAFPDGSAVNNLPTMKETQKTQVVSLLGRSPGGGNGNPLEYSCLKNPMDRGTFAAKGLQRIGRD